MNGFSAWALAMSSSNRVDRFSFSKPFKKLLLQLLAGILISANGSISADEQKKLPPSAIRIVEQIERERLQADMEYQEQATKLLTEAIDDLDAMVLERTKALALDEAVAIRDAIRAAAEVEAVSDKVDKLTEASKRLSDEARNRVAALVAASVRQDERHEKRLRDFREDRNEQLQAVLEELASAGNLDGALAIRALIEQPDSGLAMQAADTTASGTTTSGTVTSGTPATASSESLNVSKVQIDEKDFKKAYTVYSKAAAELIRGQKEAADKSFAEAISQLSGMQKRVARAGDLDASLAIRDLCTSVEQVASENSALSGKGARLRQIVTAQRQKLPDSAAEVADELVTKLETANRQHLEAKSSLDKAYSKPYRVWLGETFNNGDTSAIQNGVREYYQLLGEFEKVQQAFRPETIPLPEDVSDAIAHFQAEWNDHVADAERAHHVRVQKLIDTIKAADLKGAQSEAASKLIERLERDYAKSLMGFLLIPVDKPLPSEVKKDLQTAIAATNAAVGDLWSEYGTRKQAVTAHLKQARLKALADQEFLDAFGIMKADASLGDPFAGVPVKAFVMPTSTHTRNATLIEVAAGRCRIADSPFQPQGHWVDRDEILLEGEDPPDAAARAGRPAFAHYLRAPPTRRVTSSTPLVRGMLIAVQDPHRRWVKATVLQPTKTGAIVQDDTPFNREPFEVDRSQIRLP